MNEDIQSYRDAIAWVESVHPGASPEGATVLLTWDEWNAMRALLGLAKQVYCPRQKDIA